MAAIVEASHDEQGIIWPEGVAPFKVHLLNLINDKKAADKLYQEMVEHGIEVLYDDRDKAPGEKFAEADLIGIPYRLVISDKTIAQNSIEVKRRDNQETELVKLSEVISHVK